MRDKKFVIAVIVIIVLAVALLYVTLVGPKLQGYFIKQQISAQQAAVNAIIGIVEQQGYVVLNDGEKSIVLVKYVPPETEQLPEE